LALEMTAFHEKPLPGALLQLVRSRLSSEAHAFFFKALGEISRRERREFLELQRTHQTDGLLSYLRWISRRRQILKRAVFDMESLIEQYFDESVRVLHYCNSVYSPHFASGLSRFVPEVLCRCDGVAELELARIILERNARGVAVGIAERIRRSWGRRPNAASGRGPNNG
jgi:hypothetical protein